MTRWLRLLPYALVLAGIGGLVGTILVVNGGRFSYVLDDAYIHLAVAENVVRHGHYGTSVDTVANPCSSLLWPWLLVPLVAVGLGGWAPLVLNVLAALLLVHALERISALVLAGRPPRDRVWLTLLLLAPANVFGLVFTGLEHTLQVALTALAVATLAGLIPANAAGAASPAGRRALLPWLALFLGPLVRFENLALSLPILALVVLAVPAHRRAALWTLAALAVVLAAFAAAWHLAGQHPLPTSLRAKSLPLVEVDVPGRFVRALDRNLNYRQLALATLVWPLAAWVLAAPGRPRLERVLALGAAAAVAGHILLGQYGGFFRYEIAVVLAALLTALVVLRRPLGAAWAAAPVATGLAAAVAAVAVAVPALSSWPRLVPSARNLYEQQFQMHRFVVDHWRAPVAVNDLGWVAWRNPEPVLDLWGLGSPDALEARLAARRGPNPAAWDNWMPAIMAAHRTEVAVIYERWFRERPADWIRVGVLGLSGRRHTPHQSEVAFFAVDPAAAARLRAALEPWVATLPAGVRWSWSEDGDARK